MAKSGLDIWITATVRKTVWHYIFKFGFWVIMKCNGKRICDIRFSDGKRELSKLSIDIDLLSKSVTINHK